jgi:hypothetical protein
VVTTSVYVFDGPARFYCPVCNVTDPSDDADDCPICSEDEDERPTGPEDVTERVVPMDEPLTSQRRGHQPSDSRDCVHDEKNALARARA